MTMPKIPVIAKLFIALSCCSGLSAHAQTFFEMNFESEGNNGTIATGVGLPVWTLPSALLDILGSGALFELTSADAHSGSYSLKFDYDGLNGFCNACGLLNYTADSSLNNADYFIDSAGNDLADTTDSGPSAQPGRIVFDLSGGFSRWQIDAVTNENAVNDRLNLSLLDAGIHGETGINASEEIGIAKQCDVDGTIGGEIDRRSDCNKAIIWFGNIDSSQNYGESVFRRVYVKAEILTPTIHQKINYWRTPSITGYFPDGTDMPNGEVVLFADANATSSKPLRPVLTGLNPFGGAGYFEPGVEGMSTDVMSFERGVWYYVEQEFKAESAPGAADGAYRLWLAKSGEETDTPVLEVTGLTMPPVDATSFWGNVQHWTHSYGVWYIDDMKIANTRIGFDVTANASHTAPPGAVGNASSQ